MPRDLASVKISEHLSFLKILLISVLKLYPTRPYFCCLAYINVFIEVKVQYILFKLFFNNQIIFNNKSEKPEESGLTVLKSLFNTTGTSEYLLFNIL